jgi:hypothetical protein
LLFWRDVFCFYRDTPFETPNFWQERVKLWGRLESQTWRDTVLGHLFFPEHYLSTTMPQPESNKLFNLLSGASAKYNNPEGCYWYHEYGNRLDIDTRDFDWDRFNKEKNRGLSFLWASTHLHKPGTAEILRGLCEKENYTRALMFYGMEAFSQEELRDGARDVSLIAFKREASRAAITLYRYYRLYKNLSEEEKYRRIIDIPRNEYLSLGEDHRWMDRQILQLFGVPYEGIDEIERLLS